MGISKKNKKMKFILKFNIKQIFWGILFLFLLYAFTLLFEHHLKIIFYPHQLDLREGAPLLLVSEFIKGNIPYTFKNQPYLSDVFGCMYSLFSIPFIKLFGLELSSMRILTSLCIFFVSIYFFKLTYRLNKSVIFSLVLSLVFYGLNLFTVIPIVRPDSLGFLFFVLSLYFPIQRNFTRNSLLFSILFSFFAYLTKSYFIIGFPFVLVYIFLVQSKLRAVKFFTLFIVFFVALQVVIYQVFDFYFIGTFSNQLSSTVNDFNHLIIQLRFYFLELMLIPSFIFLYYTIRLLIQKKKIIDLFFIKPFDFLNYFSFEKISTPLLRDSKIIDLNVLYFVLGLILVIFKLGGHTGQFGVYLVHFLSFPLLLYIGSVLKKESSIFVGILFVLTLSQVISILKIDRAFEIKSSFKKEIATISRTKEVLTSPILASELVKLNKYVYASGLTEYFFYVPELKNNYGVPTILATLKDKLLLDKINESEKKITAYLDNISNKIQNRTFDLIYLDNTIYDDWLLDKKVLLKNYQVIDSVDVPMYASFQVIKVYKYIPRLVEDK